MKRPRIKSSHSKPTKRPTKSNTVAKDTLDKVLEMLNLHMDNVDAEVRGDGGQGSPMKALYDFEDQLKEFRKKYDEPKAPAASIPNERNFPRECC